ncbi:MULTISPECIES: DEAD/DEAH box helicase [Pseudonocardia]|uniref:DEAD/DEAH box helicase n=1 Tax=Pseudonocardia TaxID=1847 RepID=UPI000F7A7BED|nr:MULTISPECIES: DEAD/DEAH box helicase [Pseudonocardia]
MAIERVARGSRDAASPDLHSRPCSPDPAVQLGVHGDKEAVIHRVALHPGPRPGPLAGCQWWGPLPDERVARIVSLQLLGVTADIGIIVRREREQGLVGDEQESAARHFRGLFVGVDRYQSRAVRRLVSAVRDVTALHAVFSDNLGGTSTLLTDATATRPAVLAALEDLRRRSTADDVVVVAFSGHGSDTHELVTHDADPENLPTSSISLDEFTDLVSAIPARQLVVVLDCCFSGGAGAKVLNAPLIPRGAPGGLPASTEARLDRMAGVGRLILTASTGDQEAWEDPRLGHGLLTYHLIQALLGAAAPGAHQVALYDLLAYVVREVKAKASGTVAARQEPSLRGHLDGELVWPVFAATGPLYSELYPQTAMTPATEDLAGLRDHGVPQTVLDAWSTRIRCLNPLQIAAINEGDLLRGGNVLAVAPTSSGKTMLGELAAVRAARVGGRSVFLLPTKALVNEQYDRFAATYRPVGLHVLRATGEHSDDVPALLQGQFDLAVLTYEKFAGLALGNPHLLKMLSVVVIDEVQTLVDRGRGAYLEFLLTLLKVRRAVGVAPQVVALSAVLGDLGGLDSWLEATVIRRNERPVPLLEGVLGPDGVFRHLAEDGSEATEPLIAPAGWVQRNRDLVIPLVAKLVADGQQVIVFRSTRGATRFCARYLADSLGLPAATTALDGLASADPSVVLSELRRCLAGGAAFHISDLARDEKIVLEEQFRAPDSRIRVLVSTTTLAQGVNLPAETVVIVELDHPGAAGTTTPYTVAEYKNIAGRAGRLGLTAVGRSVLVVNGPVDAQRRWEGYVSADPEDLHSQLLDVCQDVYTLVLRVVAVAARRGEHLAEDDVRDFLANSFAAHQHRTTAGVDPFPAATVSSTLDELVSVDLMTSGPSGLALTELGTYVAQSGLRVSSAVRVARVLRTLPTAHLNRATLIAAAQLTDELDEVRIRVNKRGWQREQQTFFTELRRHRTAERMLAALPAAHDAAVGIARAKRVVACLLWTGGVAIGRLEELLMKHLPGNDAAGSARAVAARTQDVIGAVVEIARCLHPGAELDRLAGQLPVQLEFGIPAELVPLALHADGVLGRPDLLRLLRQGLTDPAAILMADDDTLAECVGSDASRVALLRRVAQEAQDDAHDLEFADVLPVAVD